MPAAPDEAAGQAVADLPPKRPLDREALTPAGAGAMDWRLLRSPPVIIAVCVALAVLSAAVLPTVPSYDPFSWIVWGREISDPHLSFVTGGGPSWKPLPVIFTTVYGLFYGAAPTLWVITARAGGLLGLVGAWRLAARVVAPLEIPLAGPIAGLVAVLGVVLTQDWVYYMFRGASEPMLIATATWSVDRLLDRRYAQAFVIAALGGLIRPEWWPFLAAYGLWLWFKQPRWQMRLLVICGWVAQPFFWFVPPWIGSGQPFLAAVHAQEYNGHLGAHPVLTAIGRAQNLQVRAVLILAAVAVIWTLFEERDRLTLAIAAGGLAWVAVVLALTIDGYPGLERFFLPASAMACVLAGVGAARISGLASRRITSPTAARLAGVGVAAAVLALSIPLSSSRISDARAQEPTARRAVTIFDQLSDAVKAVGGAARLYPCKSSLVTINHSAQTALAWKLQVPMTRVVTVLHAPGVDFIGPHNSIDGGAALVSHRLTVVQPLAQVGDWRVVRLTAPGDPANACVGR
jgi:hypothetical protein